MRTCCFLIAVFLLCAFSSVAHAQSCNTNMAASTPDSQLVDNGDDTITDSATGLMWKKCVEGMSGPSCGSGSAATFTWQTALQQPGLVNGGGGFAGHTDWRLPNIKELRSIVEEKCVNLAINLTRFPNTPSWNVWSGSPHAGATSHAWYAYFNYGHSYYAYRYFNDLQVRLVRSGQ